MAIVSQQIRGYDSELKGWIRGEISLVEIVILCGSWGIVCRGEEISGTGPWRSWNYHDARIEGNGSVTAYSLHDEADAWLMREREVPTSHPWQVFLFYGARVWGKGFRRSLVSEGDDQGLVWDEVLGDVYICSGNGGCTINKDKDV